MSNYNAKFSLLLQIQELALKLKLSDEEANAAAYRSKHYLKIKVH